MKTRNYFLICLLVLSFGASAQPFVEQPDIILTGIFDGSTAWGDYDNDGDLDIILTGSSNPGKVAKIYRNNYPENSFTEQSSISLTGVERSSVAWGDYDKDGDLDIFLTGYKGNPSPVFCSKIFRNNYPENSFTEQIDIIVAGISDGSVVWGDYDNDGDLDILLSGSGSVTKIYRNNYPENSFTVQSSIALAAVNNSSVAWGDYDNDGDLDILLTGYNYSVNPPAECSKIYRNDYPENSFTEQTEILLTGVLESAVAWGDYDNDGDLDILLTGGDDNYGKFSKIYRNNYPENSFTEQTIIILDLYREGSVAWGDYDNDGDMDILLTGQNFSINPPAECSKIYRNNYPENTFTEQTDILLTAVGSSSAVWGDYDNDGDLDILLTGMPFGSSNVTSKIFRNNGTTFNTVPDAPTDLSYDGTTFSWNKSNDDQTPQDALTYNIRIGNNTNRDLLKPSMANTSTGYRKIVDMGNVQLQTRFDLNIHEIGEFVWSVQALDNAFAGSPFASEQSFIIGATISPRTEQNIAAGSNGTPLTVSEYQASSSRDWKYSFIHGGDYQSFVPAQTGISFMPNFQIGQTYYIICQSTQNGVTYTSNEVIINVTPYADAVATNRIEFYQNVTPSPDNPENLIMPGKKVRFKLRTANNYTQNLLTLKGYIRSDNPYITILDSIGTFNNILMGQEGWTSDYYEVQVSPDLPPNAQIFFLLTMRDEIVTTEQWKSQFGIPFLQVSNVYFDDDNFRDSQGNNNQTVQNGETIEILPLVKNKSVTNFYSVSGNLTSSTAGASIWNNQIGVNTLVMDTYPYNVQSNGQISSDVMNIRPAQDFVCNYTGVNNSTIGFNLKLTAYANAPQGSSWDNGGVLMKFGAPFTLQNGQSQSPEMGFINSAADAVKYNRIEFYQNVTPSDENPANLIGPGRKVRFKLRVINDFEENLPTLKAVLSSTSNKVTITDNTATLNNVDKNAQIWTSDEFEIVIDDDMTGVGEISFTVTVSEQIINAGPWTSTFKIPIPNIVATVIDDDPNPDSNGNDNDIAEPGETIEIIPLLANQSSSTLYNVFGTLWTNTSYIHIWNDQQGSTSLVYDTYPYNAAGGNHTPIAPGATNVQPEQDFVFDHNGTEAYSLGFNLYLWGYDGAPQGSSWDNGGVFMKWDSPLVMNQGQPSEPLTVVIYNPADGSSISKGSQLEIMTLPVATQSSITKVDFYVDGSLIGTDNTSPYSYVWNTSDYVTGLHSVKVIATDNNQLTAFHQISIYMIDAVNIELNGLFSFSLNESIFQTIPPENRVFTVTLQDGSQLPPWLTFDGNTLTFSGNAPLSPGTYVVSVVVTGEGNTSILYAFYLYVGSGPSTINEDGTTYEIRFYPNPNNGSFTFEYANKKINNVNASIFDMSGRCVFQKEYLNQNVITDRIYLNGKGIHVVKIVIGDSILYSKIVVY